MPFGLVVPSDLRIGAWGRLEFDRVPTTHYTNLGTPFTRWVPTGMPKIPEEYRQCVFYLYQNRQEAELGENSGGTGFLVMVESEPHSGMGHIHGVSNWHVAVNGGCSVLRINTHRGAPEIVEFDPSDWIFASGGPDVAITPPLSLDSGRHKARALVDSALFISRASIQEKEIGAGEDAFMVGRFVDLDSGPTNEPALRFGHISVMPTPIKHKTGYVGDAYCIDMHSRTAFSGSPVFAFRTTGSDLGDLGRLDVSKTFSGLLGVHIGQFREIWNLDIDGKAHVKAWQGSESLYLDAENIKIRGLSGMTCVAPAWDIGSLLYSPEVREMRKKADRNYKGPPAPEPEFSRSPKDTNPDAAMDAVLRTMLNTPPEPHKEIIKKPTN